MSRLLSSELVTRKFFSRVNFLRVDLFVQLCANVPPPPPPYGVQAVAACPRHSRLSVLQAADDDGVPQRVELRPAVVEDTREPREERARRVVESVVETILVDPVEQTAPLQAAGCDTRRTDGRRCSPPLCTPVEMLLHR